VDSPLFLTGGSAPVASESRVSTLMFTDIVGSTEMAVEKGNLRFADLLEIHHEAVRSELSRYRGEEISTAGDGFLASFDGPARGIKCAQAIVKSLAALGISCRIEIRHGELQGIALHIAARVAGLAPPNGVFVSQTVKDLVAGSGIRFADAGLHALKGLPEKWRLYEVISQ
jgi:class 3 adenylate cyclase